MCVWLYVYMFELYRRLSGWTDFLEIFTVSSGMSGKISNEWGATPTYTYCKLITKWVYCTFRVWYNNCYGDGDQRSAMSIHSKRWVDSNHTYNL